jgi:TRAP-type C4-dicarboxylate transport system permease small subunit
VLAWLDRISAWLAGIAGAALVLLAIFVCVDIVARRFFGFSLQGSDELGGYVLALVGAMGFAYVLAERAFTRIDLALVRFPLRLRAALNALAYVSLAGFALFMAWFALGEFRETLLFQTISTTPLQTPLWIPQSLWLAGIGLFAFAAVVHAVRAVVLSVHDPQALEAAYGTRGVTEELEAFQDERTAAADRAGR